MAGGRRAGLPTKELRIGLVLYGGVSLAVYMNGIVTELWHLLRAAKDRSCGGDCFGGTAAFYRGLLRSIAETRGFELRPVVDTIAGSSAGGVNGVALSKAIAEGADASLLGPVWTEEADIALLRDDAAVRAPFLLRAPLAIYWSTREAVARLTAWRDRRERKPGLGLRGIDVPWLRDQAWSAIFGKDPRRTPLKGTFFATIVGDTLQKMNASAKPADRLLLPDATLDLYLTQTDVFGWPRHLPVSTHYHPNSLKEQTHAHWIHLEASARQMPNLPPDFDSDFGADGDWALTFAGRTTAGFPFAFAPTTAGEVGRVLRGHDETGYAQRLEAFHRRHLPEHALEGVVPEKAWMVDGGVIDNRPFGYVVEAIERKPARNQVERVVVYVEPDPEEPPVAGDGPPAPGALAKHMLRLLRYEPILNDLERLRARNARVRRLTEIAARTAEQAEAALDRLLAQDGSLACRPGGMQALADAMERALGENPPLGYPAYLDLKRRRAAETIGSALCRAFNYPYESTAAFLLREAARSVLLSEGGRAETGEQLSSVYELPFRERRIRYLVRCVNELYGELRAKDESLRTILDGLKAALAETANAFADVFGNPAQLRKDVLAVLETMGAAASELERVLEEQTRGREVDLASFSARFGPTMARVRDRLADAIAFTTAAQADRLLERLAEQLAELEDAGRPDWAERLCRAHALFPLLDCVLFPLMDTAEVQDLYEVQVMRISPQDGVTLAGVREDLRSRKLGAFFGFFDRPARKLDLLWGRLDGAERIVDLLARAAHWTEEERAAARRDALLAVLAEQLPGDEELAGEVARLRKALAATGGSAAEVA